jgi:hypothetical protein
MVPGVQTGGFITMGLSRMSSGMKEAWRPAFKKVLLSWSSQEGCMLKKNFTQQ